MYCARRGIWPYGSDPSQATFGQLMLMVMANKSDERGPMPERMAQDWKRRFDNGR